MRSRRVNSVLWASFVWGILCLGIAVIEVLTGRAVWEMLPW